MAKQAASGAEMLEAIIAIMSAAILVLDDTNPVPRQRGQGFDDLEDAYEFAKGLLVPAQWGNPTFVTLAELLHAAWPAIHCRTLRIDSSPADLELAAAVEGAQDFLVRFRGALN
jgi:hypothetical protein